MEYALKKEDVFKYLKYIILFALIVLITVIVREAGWEKETGIRYASAIAVFLVCGYWYINRSRMDNVKIILICGIILRIGYMLYTPMMVRSHDLGDVNAYGTGHYGYIYRILTTGAIPDSNDGQFYHPPLFYMLSAWLVKLLSLFIKGDYAHMIEYSKIISCFFGCMTTVIIARFAREAGFKAGNIITAITAFFPNLILMSGRVNNDALSVFFIALCLYYTYKWYNTKSIKDITILALNFGFGMMSKISCGTMALFTGTIMIIELYKAIKNKNASELIKQYIIFAVICVPVALWYPIRNYIAFNQSFSYTPAEIFVTADEKSGAAMIRKFLSFKIWKVIGTPYENVMGDDINIWNAILRTSMFGEFFYSGKDITARILATVNITVIITSIISFVYVIWKGNKIKPIVRYGLLGVWASSFIPYIWLNYKIPKNFTMDFRYISVTVIAGACYMALMYETNEKSSQYIKFITGLFCVASVAMFVL